VRWAENLNNLPVSIVLKSGSLKLLETAGSSRAVMGLLYLLPNSIKLFYPGAFTNIPNSGY
jgi:hypothetical protein